MSVADTVRTGKRSLQFFRGGSKFQVYIGSSASPDHGLLRERRAHLEKVGKEVLLLRTINKYVDKS